MKKVIATLLISIFFLSGCQMVKISNKDIQNIVDAILDVDNNLSNTFMEGYSLYLPQGVKLVNKKDYNLVIEDNDKNRYYLYIDTIAYHYKTHINYQENNSHFYSQKFNYNGKEGYIDITEELDNYFVVLMYNYAKIEAFVTKDSLDKSIINMCSIIGTIKYNDKVISNYVGNQKKISQEENFNLFESKIENDNFLKYEEEYGTYKETIDINVDNDIIDFDETIE